MELRATRRRDGAPMDAGELEAPPFLGLIEFPPAGQAETKGYPVLHVEGWVASRRGRAPARVRLQAGDAPPVEVVPDRERGDVVTALEPAFPAAWARCGFIAHVQLPRAAGSRMVPVAITVDDGEFTAHGVLPVRHAAVPSLRRADYAATWDRESVDSRSRSSP